MNHGNWTEERVEMLRDLWSQGLSASQVAAKIGDISRNAIIGKVHRLGLQGRDKPAAPGATRTNRPDSPRRIKPRVRVVSNQQTFTEPKQRPAKSDYDAKEFEPIEGATPVRYMDLRPCHCRWPVGDLDGEMLSCGLQRAPERAYCAEHVAAGTQKAHTTPKELVRLLRRYL